MPFYNQIQEQRSSPEWKELELSFINMRNKLKEISELEKNNISRNTYVNQFLNNLTEYATQDKTVLDVVTDSIGSQFVDQFVNYISGSLESSIHSSRQAKKYKVVTSDMQAKDLFKLASNKNQELTKAFEKSIKSFLGSINIDATAELVKAEFSKAQASVEKYAEITEKAYTTMLSNCLPQDMESILQDFKDSQAQLRTTVEMFKEHGTVRTATPGSGFLFENMLLLLLAQTYTNSELILNNATNGNVNRLELKSTGTKYHGLTSDLMTTFSQAIKDTVTKRSILGITAKAHMQNDQGEYTFSKAGSIPEINDLVAIFGRPEYMQALLYYISNYYALHQLYAPERYPRVFGKENETIREPAYQQLPGRVIPDIYRQIRTTVGLYSMLSALLGILTNGKMDGDTNFMEAYKAKGLPLILSFPTKDV